MFLLNLHHPNSLLTCMRRGSGSMFLQSMHRQAMGVDGLFMDYPDMVFRVTYSVRSRLMWA